MRAESRGFSLLEVLVALAVLALAMAALVRAAGWQAGGLDAARRHGQAQWVAANVLAEARLTGVDAGERSGTMVMGRQSWPWRLDVLPQPGGLRRLEVHVFDARDGDEILVLDGFAESP